MDLASNTISFTFSSGLRPIRLMPMLSVSRLFGSPSLVSCGNISSSATCSNRVQTPRYIHTACQNMSVVVVQAVPSAVLFPIIILNHHCGFVALALFTRSLADSSRALYLNKTPQRMVDTRPESYTLHHATQQNTFFFTTCSSEVASSGSSLAYSNMA
jgi:hypothetical protein